MATKLSILDAINELNRKNGAEFGNTVGEAISNFSDTYTGPDSDCILRAYWARQITSIPPGPDGKIYTETFTVKYKGVEVQELSPAVQRDLLILLSSTSKVHYIAIEVAGDPKKAYQTPPGSQAPNSPTAHVYKAPIIYDYSRGTMTTSIYAYGRIIIPSYYAGLPETDNPSGIDSGPTIMDVGLYSMSGKGAGGMRNYINFTPIIPADNGGDS